LAWIGLPGSLLGLGASACWGRLCDRRTSLETLQLVWICGALSPCIAYVATTPWMYSASSLTNALFGPGLEIVATLVIVAAARTASQALGDTRHVRAGRGWHHHRVVPRRAGPSCRRAGHPGR